MWSSVYPLEAHGPPPQQIILDLDATNDPLHGHQQARFFHGCWAAKVCLDLAKSAHFAVPAPSSLSSIAFSSH